MTNPGVLGSRALRGSVVNLAFHLTRAINWVPGSLGRLVVKIAVVPAALSQHLIYKKEP